MAQSETRSEEKNIGGRPLKFKSAQQLKELIDSYFNRQDPHTETRRVEDGVRPDGTTNWVMREVMTPQRPYGIMGLAYAIGTNRETLLDYESGKHDEKADDYDEDSLTFSDVVKEAKQRIVAQVEERMLDGTAPSTPSIFWLKNHTSMNDKTNVDLTSNGEPVKALVEIVRSGGQSDSKD